jgi:hypothetical protein
MEVAVRKKCIVMNCTNHTDEGGFIGDLCSPCHKFVTSGRGKHSQAYRNSKSMEPRRMILDLEFVAEFDPDRQLTCLFCRLRNCDHEITLRGNGTRMIGLHLKCLESHEAVVASFKRHNTKK